MIDTLTRALLPIFLIIALGVIAGRSGRLDNGKVGPLNTLVMDFALPAAMFGAVTRTSRAELALQWTLLVALTACLLGMWLAIYLLQRRLFRQSSGDASVMAISVALPNFAAAGVPLLSSVFGNHGRIQVALAIAIGAVVLSPLTLILLDIDRARREGSTAKAHHAIRAAIERVAVSPLVLAPIIGVVFVLVGVKLPVALQSSFDLLGQASSGVALLLTGLVLSANRIALTTKVMAAVFIANVLRPVLSLGLVQLLPMAGQVEHATILLSALPAGFFGIFFALRYGTGIKESATVVAISTATSIVTLAATMALTAGMG